MSQSYEDRINQLYDSQLTATKSQLQTDYENAAANLTAQQEAAQKQLDKNIRLTKSEAAKAAVGHEEYYNAAGLSSGARAQARLAQDNQLLADLTALRAVRQQTDSDVERQRTLLSREYAAAISKAQAENDLARAQALYAEAKEAEQKLLAQQEAAAGLMAQTGDFSRYGQLYGLTPEELAKLSGTTAGTTTGSGTVNNGNLSGKEVAQLQRWLNAAYGAGLSEDGLYGPRTADAVKQYLGDGLNADAAYQLVPPANADYNSAVSWLHNHGFYIKNLLSEAEWVLGRQSGEKGAAYTNYDSYSDYVSDYLLNASAQLIS